MATESTQYSVGNSLKRNTAKVEPDQKVPRFAWVIEKLGFG